MIIVLRQQAQISNRLVALSALMGFCLRGNIRLVVFSLSDYRDYFSSAAIIPKISIYLLPKLLYFLLLRTLSNRVSRSLMQSLPFIGYLGHDTSWSDLPAELLNKGLWIIDGSGDWTSFMPSISTAEAASISRVLSFKSEFHANAAKLYAKLRTGCDILVGVHARRGDYLRHRGGCWYYSKYDYLSFIEQVKHQYQSETSLNVHFVVCTNEPGFLESEIRSDLSVSSLGSPACDQLLLSLCDLIIGPPSTFSVWAAFLTDTSLLHIFSSDQVLSPSQIRRSTLFYGWSPKLQPNHAKL